MKKNIIILTIALALASCKKTNQLEPIKTVEVTNQLDTNYVSCNLKYDNLDGNTTINAYSLVDYVTLTTGGDFQWKRSDFLLVIQQKTIGINKPLTYTLTVTNNKTNQVILVDTNKDISNALGYGPQWSYKFN